jgi:hypothetical protein
VEMGFSVQQARVALASTDTGLDVQAALETLLANTSGTQHSRGASPAGTPPPPSSRQRAAREREDSRNAPSPSQRNQSSSSGAGTTIGGVNTDKLLTQASEIGLSLFNRANAAWKEGRERVQKVVAESMRDTSGSPDPAASGKPKWMAQGGNWSDDEDATDSRKPKAAERFSDGTSDDSRAAPTRSRQPTQESLRTNSSRESPKSEPQQSSSRTADLLGGGDSDEPKIYKSRFRHAKPPSNVLSSSPSQAPSRSSRPPSPPKMRPRPNLVSTSQSAISSSNSHKATGTEKYKLGQYAVAEGSYTAAIECLPTGHLLLVPLFNNRAMARLKTGDFNGVVADTTSVIDIIGQSYAQTYRTEEPVTSPEHGAGVNLGDAIVKAWKRRAEALEGKEKWEDAIKDWERVAGAPSDFTSGQTRNEGVRGVGRCKKMANGPASPAVVSTPAVAPAPRRPIPSRKVKTPPPSEAAKALKKANAAAEAEEQQKAELKDTVDAKLNAWKSGKETNIRGLLGEFLLSLLLFEASDNRL